MERRTFAVAVVLGVFAAAASVNFAAGKADAQIAKAVAGDWRSADNKSRDVYRHPAEALTFWGLKPGMTVLELQPGGGWWTEILAPYARLTKGEFYATGADLSDPAISENARKGRADLDRKS